MSGGAHVPAPERGLGAQQAWLFERVTRAEGALGAAPDDSHAHVIGGGPLPAGDRIEIYRRAYWSRLVECLRDDYPAVAHALGAEVFQALCLEFIEAHPPANASLNFYGAPFAEFCASRASASANVEFVAALARLEWAIVEVIHADAETVLGAASLGAEPDLDLERACLEPSPALRVLTLSHPAHAYYRAYLDADDPLRPDPQVSWVAVCRRGDAVWRLPLEAPLALVLTRLIGGEPLGQALAALPDEPPEGVAAQAAALQRAFSEWVACGFFSAIRRCA